MSSAVDSKRSEAAACPCVEVAPPMVARPDVLAGLGAADRRFRPSRPGSWPRARRAGDQPPQDVPGAGDPTPRAHLDRSADSVPRRFNHPALFNGPTENPSLENTKRISGMG